MLEDSSLENGAGRRLESVDPVGCQPSLDNASRWRRLGRELSLFVIVPLILTALFASTNGPVHAWALWHSFIGNFLISLGIGGTITLAYEWLLPRIRETPRSRRWRPLVHVCVVLTGVFGGGEAALRLLSLFPWAPPPAEIRGGVFRVGLVVATVVTVVSVMYARLRERAREVELREERAQRAALHAQLEALQARTNPHFLFNSLNTVASLIEEDPRRAEAALERLAALFRYALDGSRKLHVPLAEELRAVRSYLEVEGLRFGPRLSTEIDVEPGTETLLVPPLVLQPLVENAVLHGVASRREGGRVTVSVARLNRSLVLRVEDDGPGPGGSKHAGSRTGLADLRQRLDLLYGDAARLETVAAPGGGYRVQLQLPLTAPPEST